MRKKLPKGESAVFRRARWLLAGSLFSFGMSYGQYCAPSGDCTSWGDEISSFQFGAFSHNSSCSPQAYHDYTGIGAIAVTAGSNQSWSVSLGAQEQQVAIWIDFNNDGDFLDTDEFFGSVYSGMTYTAGGNVPIPAWVPPGTYRLRVRCMYDYTGTDVFYQSDECMSVIFGETHDYTLAVVGACTSPPVAGAVVGPSTVCASQNFTLSANAGAIGIGTTYQWQSSPDGVTWSDMSGQTNASVTQQINAPVYYRLIVTCSGASDTTTAHLVSPGMLPSCYCSSGSYYPDDTHIDRVEIDNIFSNQSSPGCVMYTDFSSVPAPLLFIGNSYNIVVTQGSCGGSYSAYAAVFIDFDQNGQFDASELITLTPPSPMGVGAHTGTIAVPQSAVTGTTVMRVIVSENFSSSSNILACGQYNYGETEDYLVTILPIPPDDAGLSAIVSPSSGACSLGGNLEVKLANGGSNALTSADISWQVNGGSVNTFNWTGNIASGADTHVVLGAINLQDGDVLKVWTSSPNGQSDLLSLNDTIQTTVYQGMAGSYTVGGTSPNFNTIVEALQELAMRGVCADVTFDIRSGAYNTQFVLPTFTASTPGARVIIQSESQTASDVELVSSATGSNNNYLVRFDNSDYYTLRHLTLRFGNPSYSVILDFVGGSDSNIVEHCIIHSDSLGTSDNSNTWAIRSSLGIDNNNIFRHNYIVGGSRSVSFGGQDIANPESGNRFENNFFRSSTLVALAMFYQKDPVIKSNVFNSNRTGTSPFRIFLRDVYSSGEISGNEFLDNLAGPLAVLYNVNGPTTSPFLVYNNFLYSGSTSTVTDNIGILLTGGQGVDIVNNSISVAGSGVEDVGILIQNETASNLIANGINIYNNNIVHTSGGMAMQVASTSSIGVSNNNNFYTSGSQLVKVGTSTYANLGAYQSATGQDANSISVDPAFNGSDLHTCEPALNAAGMPYAAVTTDFDGELRNTPPDIGADEFTPAGMYSLGPDILKCSNDSVTLGGAPIAGAQYFWSNFSNDPNITVIAPGQYSVMVINSCGTSGDTIVVADHVAPSAMFTSSLSFQTAIFNASGSTGLNISYDWDFGDGNVGNGPNPIHVYSQDGSYTVTLTVTDECGITATYTEVVTITTVGIGEEQAVAVNIWPNPAREMVHIQLNASLSEEAQIYLRDLTGRILQVIDTSGLNAGETLQIPLDRMSSGVYLLQINDRQIQSMHRVVVQ